MGIPISSSLGNSLLTFSFIGYKDFHRAYVQFREKPFSLSA